MHASNNQKLLTETDKNISDISYLCGFSSSSQFSSFFKKSVGCKPSEYRKSNKIQYILSKQKIYYTNVVKQIKTPPQKPTKSRPKRLV